jgi:hypothetical protein
LDDSGAEVIGVVEADIVVHFSHRFPWGLARLRHCQWQGADKACMVLLRSNQ